MKVRWTKGKEDLKDAMMIREEVFVKEQKVPMELEMDDIDDVAHHVVMYVNDEPITVGRLFDKEKHYVIGRVAVLKEFRGKQYGKILMEKIMEKAEELGAKEIRIHAQVYAENFYEKLGFEAYGDIFDDAGIDHISMKKYL